MERLKKWGEMATALTVIAALFSGMIAAFGGHIPPYMSWAEGMTLEDAVKNNAQATQQLTVVILSDKVADIQTVLAANPSDKNLRSSLLYWQQQPLSPKPPRFLRVNKGALMWSAIVNFAIWILGLFGFGKPDPMAQGEKLGKSETTAADALGELADVQKANVARQSVDNGAAAIVRDPDNTGPAK